MSLSRQPPAFHALLFCHDYLTFFFPATHILRFVFRMSSSSSIIIEVWIVIRLVIFQEGTYLFVGHAEALRPISTHDGMIQEFFHDLHTWRSAFINVISAL
jgi:hypothetical protein